MDWRQASRADRPTRQLGFLVYLSGTKPCLLKFIELAACRPQTSCESRINLKLSTVAGRSRHREMQIWTFLLK